MATCDASISTVVAPALSAMDRSVAGGMTLSSLATMYQGGDGAPGGSPEGCWRVATSAGRRLAAMAWEVAAVRRLRRRRKRVGRCEDGVAPVLQPFGDAAPT